MREDRASGCEIFEELGVRLYAFFTFIVAGLFVAIGRRVVHEFVYPVPAVHPERVYVLLYFRCLESDTFRGDEAHAAAPAVRVDTLQVAVARNLTFGRGFAVKTDRAVLYYEACLLVLRRVLQTCLLGVKIDFLYIPLNLVVARLVRVHIERRTHVVRDEDAECLSSSPRASDWSCVLNL